MAYYKILSINGGGLRGLVPAKILHNITAIASELTGGNISRVTDIFQFISGTSAGGIITAALTVPDELDKQSPKHNTSDLIDIFHDKANTIFPERSLIKGNSYLNLIYDTFLSFTHDLVYAKHSNYGLKKLLLEELGNTTLQDTVVPVAIFSYGADVQANRVWSSYKNTTINHITHYDYRLVDAALATSAAPTYLPSHFTRRMYNESCKKDSPTDCKINIDVHKFMRDIDGGVYVNSPTLAGLSIFLENEDNKDVDINDVTVLSLGTGRFIKKPEINNKEPILSYSYLYEILGGILGSVVVPMIFKIPEVLFPYPNFYTSHNHASYAYDYGYKFLMRGVIGAIIGGAIGSILGIIANHEMIYGILYQGLPLGENLPIKITQASETSDAISSQGILGDNLFKINPYFESEFSPMDNSNEEHVKRFSNAIDDQIEEMYICELLKIITKCLISDLPKNSACKQANEIMIKIKTGEIQNKEDCMKIKSVEQLDSQKKTSSSSVRIEEAQSPSPQPSPLPHPMSDDIYQKGDLPEIIGEGSSHGEEF